MWLDASCALCVLPSIFMQRSKTMGPCRRTRLSKRRLPSYHRLDGDEPLQELPVSETTRILRLKKCLEQSPIDEFSLDRESLRDFVCHSL